VMIRRSTLTDYKPCQATVSGEAQHGSAFSLLAKTPIGRNHHFIRYALRLRPLDEPMKTNSRAPTG
jgi:hypothetical protein